MKKTLLLASFFIGGLFATNAQTVLFEDSFEDYDDFAIDNVGDWTLIDVDGSPTYGFEGINFTNSGVPMAFIVFNSTATAPILEPSEGSDWTGRTGEKAMLCFAAVQAPNNDWLISPQIPLGTTGNQVSFWSKAGASAYGEERFNVGISTTGTDPADFTIIASNQQINSTVTYQEFTFDLDDYAEQTVYIAIQCVSNDQFGFFVDDFVVTAETVSVNSPLAGSFSVYPNPAKDVLNISNSISAEISSVTIADVNGRIVKQFEANGAVDSQINIADLNAGVYFVNINSNEGSLTKKIVKQ